MYTEFGKYVRKLRIDNDEILKDMASKLNVSSSFLSSLETGKKAIPVTIFDKLTKNYNLSQAQQVELRRAIDLSTSVAKISLSGTNSEKDETAVLFARTFEDIDDSVMLQIKKLLTKGK